MTDPRASDVHEAVRRGVRRSMARLAGLWLIVLIVSIVLVVGAAALRSEVTAETIDVAGPQIELGAATCASPVRPDERSTCSVEITSTGSATLTVTGVRIVPGDPAHEGAWTVQSDCVGNLDPDVSCVVTVEFGTATTGSHSASLVVTHSAPGEEATVGLAIEVEATTTTGAPIPDTTPATPAPTASPDTSTSPPTTPPPTDTSEDEPIPEPFIEVADAKCDDQVYVGDDPATCVVTIRSVGADPATIAKSVVLPKDQATDGDWEVIDNCVGVLEPGATCTVQISFTAGETGGVRSATVEITHDAPSGTSSADLTIEVKAID
jgi:hypothetical protein